MAVQHVAPGAPGLTTVSGDLRLSPSMFFTYAEQNATYVPARRAASVDPTETLKAE